jgi:4-amino-4-deoxy-L-arabinose transferase-like glycosyltransferase
MLVLICAVLCLLPQPGQESGPKRVVVGGVLFGLAVLTKFMVLVTVVGVAIWLMYWKRTNGIAYAALFLVAVAMPLIVWTVYNGHVSGNAISIHKQFVEHLPDVGHLPKTAAPDVRGSKLALILKHPGEFVINFAWEFYHFWELSPHRLKMNNDAQREEYHAEASQVVRKTVVGKSWTSLISMLSVGPMFFFALIGCGTMALQAEQRRAWSLFSMTIFSLAIGYSFFISKMRYRIPIEPYIVIFSAYGLMQVWTLFTRWKPVRAACTYRQIPDSGSSSGSTMKPSAEGAVADTVRTSTRQSPSGPVSSSD